MTRIPGIHLAAALAICCLAAPAGAWPAPIYAEIFANARQTLPGPLRQLLEDMDPLLSEACRPTSVDEAAAEAIARFSDAGGGLPAAVASMRDAGCAAAEMNDPDMDALVETQRSRFPVVFYGWHPAIRDGNLGGYLEARRTEIDNLASRFRRTSELPNRSEMVELSPEFGMASLAWSHAVTDVANVWLYIWISVNGSF